MVIAVADDGRVVELSEDGTWRPTTRGNLGSGDFRGIAWGAARSEVAASQSNPTFQSEDLLVYTERLVGLAADAIYIFVAGRLVRGKYMFTEVFTSPNRYLDAFESVRTLFERKYGPSPNNRQIWHDNLYRNDPGDWGLAVERGDLTLMAEWATSTTEIGLLLHGNDYEAKLVVEYESIAFKPWAEGVTSQNELGLI